MRQPKDVGFRHGWLFAPPGEAPRMQVACIGGACVDRSYTLHGAVFASSNPARRAPRSFGGVARNVCENLARLGVDAALVSAAGNDADGRAMLEELRACGARVDLVKIVDGGCDEYAAVLDGAELLIGAADMRAIEAFSVDDLIARWGQIAAASFVFVDCNVSAAVLAECLQRAARERRRVAVDAVSEPKVLRLPPRLDGIDVLFINEGEARAYLERAASGGELAAALLQRGAGAVVLTAGERGVICADDFGSETLAAPSVPRVSVTGAGDALAAGTLRGLLVGDPLRRAVDASRELAALTLQSPFSVWRG